MIKQYEIQLPAFKRGFHLITDLIMNEIPSLPETGLIHIFIQHTSAALTINENADRDVRVDFESWMDKAVKENEPYYTHTTEGQDDMPAHIKSALMGSSVSIPVMKGKLNMGTWQGIYLCEFRDHGGKRKLVVTLIE
ncbi:MAG: hypothetical protein JWN78_3301 [Bacteroidota bacterium]|nr:hypothetical protein [Bacteroidota bacterium]